MSFDPVPSMRAIQDVLNATTVFSPRLVSLGQPFGLANRDLAGAVYCIDWEPTPGSLSTMSEVWTFGVRIYSRRGQTPADAETAETRIGTAFGAAVAALAAHFGLEGTVRAINVYGEVPGRRMSARWDYLMIMDSPFRIVDLILPAIADDTATFHS